MCSRSTGKEMGGCVSWGVLSVPSSVQQTLAQDRPCQVPPWALGLQVMEASSLCPGGLLWSQLPPPSILPRECWK